MLSGGLIMFYRPVTALMSHSSGDINLAVNAVRFAAFVFTGIISFLVSYTLARLRSRMGSVNVLLPRLY
jgi:hypothetical protein